MKSYKYFFSTIIFIGVIILLLTSPFLFGGNVLAQTRSGGTIGTECPPATGGFSNPLGTCNIFTILKDIISYLILIGAPIVVIMVLYGGFLILTAGDSPEKVQGGRKTIQWAAIGYAIILCSWGIIYIIGEILGTDLVR